MMDERPIIEQDHKIQSLAKEHQLFKCMLVDTLVVGGIIA
jgi:hypothetical protein